MSVLNPWTTTRRWLTVTSAALTLALVVGCDDRPGDTDIQPVGPGVPGATTDPSYDAMPGDTTDPYADPAAPGAGTGFDDPAAPGGAGLGDPAAPGGAMTGPDTFPSEDPLVEPPAPGAESPDFEGAEDPVVVEEPAEPDDDADDESDPDSDEDN